MVGGILVVSGCSNIVLCSVDDVDGGLASLLISPKDTVLVGMSILISSSSANDVCFNNNFGAGTCLGLS